MSLRRHHESLASKVGTLIRDLWREVFIVYERVSCSSNIESSKVVCNREVNFIYNCLTPEFSLKELELASLRSVGIGWQQAYYVGWMRGMLIYNDSLSPRFVVSM